MSLTNSYVFGDNYHSSIPPLFYASPQLYNVINIFLKKRKRPEPPLGPAASLPHDSLFPAACLFKSSLWFSNHKRSIVALSPPHILWYVQKTGTELPNFPWHRSPRPRRDRTPLADTRHESPHTQPWPLQEANRGLAFLPSSRPCILGVNYGQGCAATAMIRVCEVCPGKEVNKSALEKNHTEPFTRTLLHSHLYTHPIAILRRHS